jgi:hypothetical protein
MPQRSPPGWSADRTARRVTAANRFRRKAQAIGLWTVNLIGRAPVSHILGYARVSTDDKTSPVRERAHRIRRSVPRVADVISGKTVDRPCLADFLAVLRSIRKS